MSVEPEEFASERYRRLREPCSREFDNELTQISSDIADPIAKLRYLRGAIEHNDGYSRRVQKVPCGPVRRALYRLRGLEALDTVVGHDALQSAAVRSRTLVARKRARRIVAGTVATSLLLVPALLVGLALQIEPDAEPSHALAVPAIDTGLTSSLVEEIEPPMLVSTRQDAPAVAETLPEEALGVAPTTIWLADRGSGWELYSNGLRIETAYAVTAEPRRYKIHDREHGLLPAIHTRPVGILFHTSESDLWPLAEDYDKQLRRSSTNLLRYVRSTKAYNYVIDRFGRVYRVVDDDTRASHAGHSVWANGDEVYLDLNSAFLGVSFESRWEGGHTLPITRAQLIAGRNLTNYLRQRFAIAPEMCVTHGLTSVSPRQHLIGYHRDWARGFPFAAFGLPDLYAQPLPSVALFGFSYDMEFTRAIGEPWPGLSAAEQSLTEGAQQRGLTLDAFRSERRALYRHWSGQVRGGESPSRESKVQKTSHNRVQNK
jgi:hypothetical protein